MSTDITRNDILAGWVGLIGALLVGIAEGLVQFNSAGIYESPDYSYFADISQTRLTIGMYLGAFAAPLYMAGYYFLARLIAPAGERVAILFGFTGAYSFAVGTVWLGQRSFLALTRQAIDQGNASEALLQDFATLNEPLVNVLRVAMLIVSSIWVWKIMGGKTVLPKWMAIFNPILLLAIIFALYIFIPTVGRLFLPTAMNTAHFIVFGLALYCCYRQSSKNTSLN